jgi:hypothetical protein
MDLEKHYMSSWRPKLMSKKHDKSHHNNLYERWNDNKLQKI